MPKLIINGSSSKGNNYILQCNNESLIIECGVPLDDVKKSVNFKIDDWEAAIASHV